MTIIAKFPSEHIEQREVVKWVRQNFPGVRIFAIPNGGARSPSSAMRLKLEGVSAGVPDLFIPAWLLWIEMKTISKGRVSPDQKDWFGYLTEIGHTIILAKGADDAKHQILKFRGHIKT